MFENFIEDQDVNFATIGALKPPKFDTHASGTIGDHEYIGDIFIRGELFYVIK